jgi:hypothetical protein
MYLLKQEFILQLLGQLVRLGKHYKKLFSAWTYTAWLCTLVYFSIDADSGTILLHRLCDKESDGQ